MDLLALGDGNAEATLGSHRLTHLDRRETLCMPHGDSQASAVCPLPLRSLQDHLVLEPPPFRITSHGTTPPVSVVDTFDAITSERPYRAAQSSELALSEIEAAAGAQLDPSLVEAFLQIEVARLFSPGFRSQPDWSQLKVEKSAGGH